jgi:hypothetical protein
MIRIDEIYDNTLWPWMNQNRPGTRLFFCDPPGRSDPDALFNHGRDDIAENDYVFCHDQEPVDIDLYAPLFDEVIFRNKDLWWWRKEQSMGHVIVSERGENVQALCDKYGWQSHYYFYHGWACLDWFRGYDQTFLIPRAADRTPTQTFFSPNRIVGGRRDHRVLFLYHLFKKNLAHNYISAPRICPAEHVDIASIAQKYTNVYQDISSVFESADLPRLFAGEETQQMTSCWLSNFAEAADSMFYVPTETVYFGQRTHVTEKTFKAIALEMPFIVVAPAGTLAYLREYGFQTFGDVIDESYDLETDDLRRLEMVTDLLHKIDTLSPTEKHAMYQACLPAVEHNHQHFYKGNFEQKLWTELMSMLNGFKV